MEALIQAANLIKTYEAGSKQVQVLKGIQLDLFANQWIIIRGRSGSGKTTLLNLIGGLDTPTQGEIYFQGERISSWNDNQRTRLRKQKLGFIFQSFALMPLLSAWENVELALRMAGTPRSEWKPRIQHCLELVGLGKRMYHRPYELSGGEQQRVAIAKAIAHKPVLLLADEPTAELDTLMGAQIMQVFHQIIAEENVTVCMTTHDPTMMEEADHVYEMVDGQFISQNQTKEI